MVAGLTSLLSDHPPDVPRRAGLGDRFHYFRGRSGRRYLFTTVAECDLRDFRSAVVIAARRASGGRLAAFAATALDGHGRPVGADWWPPLVPPGTVILVHLLAASDAERRGLIADLAPTALPLAA